MIFSKSNMINGTVRSLIIFPLISFLSLSAFADQTIFRNYQNGEGLLDPQVNCIIKDSKGFIWIGTRNTIQRFDGTKSLCYNFPDNAAGTVHAILENGNNEKWIGTNSGLWKLNNETYVLEKIYKEINFPVLDLARLIDNDNIYIGTSNGLYIATPEGEVKHIPITNDVSPLNQIIDIFISSQKEIWLLSAAGLLSYNTKSGNIHNFGKGNISSDFSCMTGNNNSLFLGTKGAGLFSFDIAKKTFEPFMTIGNNIISCISAKEEELYCGTSGSGIFFLSIPRKEITHSINALPNECGEYLTSDMISCMLVDDMGIVWIGSKRYSGLDYLQFHNKPFQTYSYNKKTLQNQGYERLFISSDIKLLSTQNGFYCINESKNIVKLYQPSPTSPLRSKNITVFAEYKDYLLIGTGEGGAYKLHRNTLDISDLTSNETLKKSTITSFTTDFQNNLWITASTGMYCYDSNFKEIKTFTAANSNLINDYINYLYIDSRQRYWVATIDGMQFYRPSTNNFTQDSLPAKLLELPPVTYITEDNDNNLLFCFNKNKALVCDSTFSNIRFVCTPEDANYLGYTIRKVLQDSNNNYWFVGSRGAVKGDKKLQKFTLYSSTEGLPEPYSNDGQLYKDTIWLATPKGIVFANINAKPISAPTIITDFIVNGVSKLSLYQKDLLKKGNIVLSAKENNINISFATLTYDFPNLMIYEYKLKEYEEQWNILRGQNEVKYTHLPPGKYQFVVRKQMDENSVQYINFSIASSFPLATVIIIVTAVILLLIIVYVLTRKAKSTEKVRNKGEEEKYRFNKMDEECAGLLVKKLQEYMETEKPFLNPDLKLINLAQALGTSPQILSQVFNMFLKVRYYDFINEYRINEFKRIINANESSKYTLKALSAQCGFSSYTTFFRAFKEVSGMTPNEYIQQADLQKDKQNQC